MQNRLTHRLTSNNDDNDGVVVVMVVVVMMMVVVVIVMVMMIVVMVILSHDHRLVFRHRQYHCCARLSARRTFSASGIGSSNSANDRAGCKTLTSSTVGAADA